VVLDNAWSTKWTTSTYKHVGSRVGRLTMDS
jgi:hypothetical protein